MKCPECDHKKTYIINTRPLNNNEDTRRRRLCDKCKYRFTTGETLIEHFSEEEVEE